MKVLLVLPLLFALAAASDEDILKRNEEVLQKTLKQLEGTKFNLPKEVIEKLHQESVNIDTRASGITAEVDDYVDKLLVYVQKFILTGGFDPIEMPDTTLELLSTGSITLTSGWMQDTSLVDRNGTTTVSYSASTRVISLNLPIKFSSLLITYKYLTEVLLLSINGEAHAKVSDLLISIDLSYDYSTYQATLDKFNIVDSGSMSLTFTGNSLVDSVTNAMTSVVLVFLKPVVLQIIELLVKGNLENIVIEVNKAIASIFNP